MLVTALTAYDRIHCLYMDIQPRSVLRSHQERGMDHIAVVQKVVVPPA